MGAATTRNEPEAASARSDSSAILAAGAALLLLLILGIPVTLAAIGQLPGDRILQRLREGGAVPAADLAIARDSRLAARRYWASSVYSADLGLVAMAEAAQAPTPAARRRLLSESVAEHRRALTGRPVSTYAWTRLAQSEIALGGAGAAQAPMILRAIADGPRVHSVMANRLEIALAVWPWLDTAAREQVDDQMAALMRLDTNWPWRYGVRLPEIAHRRHVVPIARVALAGTPALLEEFDRRLQRLAERAPGRPAP